MVLLPGLINSPCAIVSKTGVNVIRSHPTSSMACCRGLDNSPLVMTSENCIRVLVRSTSFMAPLPGIRQ